MKVSEVSNDLIGKMVSVVVTGLRVNAIVTKIYDDEYSKGFYCDLLTPVQWGDDIYEKELITSRKPGKFVGWDGTEIIIEEFGPLDLAYEVC